MGSLGDGCGPALLPQSPAEGFSVDALINMALKLGLNVSLVVDNLPVSDDLTPEDVLDCMCRSAMKQDTVAFMDDVQLCWCKDWDLAKVQDPREEDALKYALKTCFLERMAEVWPEPPKYCPTHAPDWCHRVSAVQTEYSVIPGDYREFSNGDLVPPLFKKQNIFAPHDFMFFV